MISIIKRTKLIYPKEVNEYSPDFPYPEYTFNSLNTSENDVYKAVRELFIEALINSLPGSPQATTAHAKIVALEAVIAAIRSFISDSKVNIARHK